MSRITGINITALVRQELQDGLNPVLILRHARRHSTTPDNWTLNYIEKIRTQLSSRRIVRNQPVETQTSVLDIDPRITFGVEIEFLRPERISKEEITKKIRQAGLRCQTEDYNHLTKKHWKLIHDQTVRTNENNFEGENELVSPILKGIDGLKQVEKVCKALKDLGCKVNYSCGLHVHHGCKKAFQNPVTVAKNAALIYRNYQNKINQILSPSRRNCEYAWQLSASEANTISRLQRINGNEIERYRVVNLQAYVRHGTVEFRQHQGTINFKKIANWVKITQRIMIRANELAQQRTNIIRHNFAPQLQNELSFTTELNQYYEQRVQLLRLAA